MALHRLARGSLAMTLVAAAIGGVAMLGWLIDVRDAASWLPSLTPMRPNAALAVAALGLAMLLTSRGQRRRVVARLIALGAMALAGLTIGEWLMGRDLGLDNLFWPAGLEGPGEAASDRMSLGAASAFLILSLAVFARAGGPRLATIVEPAAATTALLASFAIVSIGLGADVEIAVVGSQISLPGAIAIGLLAVAVLASRPDHRIVQVLLDPGPAGRATRSILPALAAFPVMAFVVLRGFEAGVLSPSMTAVAATIMGVAYAGFLLSRSAQRVSHLDRAAVAAREARDRFFDLTGDIVVIIDPDGRLRFVSAAAAALLGYHPDAVLGRPYVEFLAADDRIRRPTAFARLLATDSERRHVERRVRHADGSWRWIEWATNTDPASGALYAVGRDVTELRLQREARDRLAAIVEESSEAVVLTDAAGTIVYVNPAFERASGRAAAEVTGLNARSLGRGPQKPSTQQAIGRAMAKGQPWSGEWTDVRSDGTTHVETVRIMPIHSRDGTVSHWAYVGNDVTEQRAAEAALEREIRDRADVVAALGRLDLSGSLDTAAEAICRELEALPGVDYAAVVAFGTTRGQVVAASGAADPDLRVGAAIPAKATARLRARAEHGPWTYVLTTNVRRETYDPLAAAGLRVLACAPLRSGTDVVGIIRIGTLHENHKAELIRLLPALSEFAAAAGGALGAALAARTADETVRAKVNGWIDKLDFTIVFQPIVDLASGSTTAFEALSRFRDGTRADQAFDAAHAVGLGLDLEIATVREALRAAADLPAGLPLDLNVSPALLLRGTSLADALADRDRPIVIEITEHEPIEDYGAVREAIQALGPDIRLAVDDAGAGAANMVHLVELRPDYVKLDVSLVRGINIDPTRQALVVGLRHFATTARCRLVAEGIETAAEATTLAAFGIEYGQGFFLGRPAEAAALRDRPLAGVPPARMEARSGVGRRRSDSASLIA